ncbi:protoporphyrinogen oxidase, mitochondrial-like isoform X1 [Actinidia eriantha]|uniref:protoporphyrinogen oxidase, mitochondrial-like isoform X1 n=3 Tax=Actinidia eriantha TaxID=165200 RepID=UPI00259113F0|nr:protoporphyrinogen oxidase, mitochondrial-like isoform X1 [Actinidia eriantha]XP_057482123.1 protoporphyrinogen oxidase, mitochondrial-like isoform X1 [Actinidia eriantha]XP_057482124.1 protoporphyrinogen oxidase, mitochondrial-like isoform X1 [Actinidia eriantha]
MECSFCSLQSSPSFITKVVSFIAIFAVEELANFLFVICQLNRYCKHLVCRLSAPSVLSSINGASLPMMQTLTDALCKELGKDELKLQSKVLELSYSCNENSPSENWSVSILNTQSEEQSYDAVIMTAPLCNVREMKITKMGSPFLLNFLPEVSYLPLSVIITTFKKASVKRPLEGFGVLVPTKEQQNGLKTLGTLFSSMMFPDRVPYDLYLYTTFVGGSRNKELAKASMDMLKQTVTSDLRQLLGAEGEPTFVNHFYWSKAFPLYGHNYDAVLQAIEKMEENLPGFFYAGNHRGGLSVGKAISSGCKAADLVISYLENSSDDKMFEKKLC